MGSWEDDDWEAAATVALPGTAAKASAAPAAPAASFSDEEEVVDSDEDDKAVEGAKPKKAGEPGKVTAKALGKAKQKELEKAMAAEAEATKAVKALSKEEKIAEKLRLQKLVEESDHAIAEDLFGVAEGAPKAPAPPAAAAVDAGGDALLATLMAVKLDSEEAYKALANTVGRRVEVEDKPFLAKEFLKEIGRAIGRSISGEDLAEVIAVLGVVKNSKVKVELGKKKKVVKGKKLNVGGGGDFDMDGEEMPRGAGGEYYGNPLDGDFM
jgi:translation initiation factor 3 subunit J